MFGKPICVILKLRSILIFTCKILFCICGIVVDGSHQHILDRCFQIDLYLVYMYDRFMAVFIELVIMYTDVEHSIKQCANCYKKADNYYSKSNRDLLLHRTVLHVPSLSLLFLSWNIVEFNPYFYYSASTGKS